MVQWGAALADINFTLRSGGAAGADSAFESGCDKEKGTKEIFLPWKNFRNHSSPLYTIPPEANEIAADIYGSGWSYIKPQTRLFMARNVLQVLGMNLDSPSIVVICWTPDGATCRKDRTKKTGGTGQAIALASERSIPLFNLKNENAQQQARDFIQEIVDNG